MSRVDLEAEIGSGIRYIETFGDGSWQPAEGGLYAALLPIYDWHGELIDIIAWELLGTGSPWWTRLGVITHLGEAELDHAHWLNRPARMVETPKGWLRDRGEAVCILDWTANLRCILSMAPEICCETPALRQRVERILAEQWRVPEVKLSGGIAA